PHSARAGLSPGRRSRRSRGRRPMSLTTRLSAFFLAALAVVLIGFSTALFVLARAYLYSRVDERLASAVDTLAAAAEFKPGGLGRERHERRLSIGEGAGDEPVRWAVRDGEGRLVTGGTARGTEDFWRAEEFGATADGGSTVSHDGQRWRVLSRRLEPDRKGTGGDRRPEARDVPPDVLGGAGAGSPARGGGGPAPPDATAGG